jgi:dTDP-4-dehydrorhamnose 3,5-epimerase
MRFLETGLQGAWVIEPEPHGDERGFLARTFCAREFVARGLCTQWVQCSTVVNAARGTLRGLHFQRAPHAEVKLVRCTAGAVYDAIVDLRPESPSFRRWFAVELSAANRRMVYVPEGFAHGMQTLTEDAELFYMMSEFYAPEVAGGVRWDDPAFGIPWPAPPPDGRIISGRDQNWPDYDGS